MLLEMVSSLESSTQIGSPFLRAETGEKNSPIAFNERMPPDTQ